MGFASVTRLRLRSPLSLPRFFTATLLVLFQARRAPGCLSARIRRYDGAFWTLTLWQDAAAMRAFMLAGRHRKTMPRIQDWCDEAALAHWTYDGAEPDWPEAAQRLKAEGRTTPLSHPSAAHAAGLTLGSSQ